MKFQRLQSLYPNSPHRFDVLYLTSSDLPPAWRRHVAAAHSKGAVFAWNQDGVAYPAWYDGDPDRVNRPMQEGIAKADHVFYQSEFCKRSADRFLREPEGTWQILYNAVDTDRFQPRDDPDLDPLVIMAGGHHYERYRLFNAIDVLAHVTETRPHAELLVTGKVNWTGRVDTSKRQALKRARDRSVADNVRFSGPYTQDQAPELFRTADVLYHPKYKDPCPSKVLEAMASGLPVVYSDSGGVPELVGSKAGIGLDVPDRWDQLEVPSTKQAARSILRVAEDWAGYSEAARSRAVKRFDVDAWRDRHRDVFGRLVDRTEPTEA